MMKIMTFANMVAFMFVALTLTSCGLIQPRETELTLEEKANLITKITKATTIVAIKELWKDESELNTRINATKQLAFQTDEILYHLIDNAATPLDGTTAERLINIIPEQYKGVFAAAYEVLNTYYEFSAPEVPLSPDQTVLLRAFILGLREGAKTVLAEHKIDFPLPHDEP